MSGILYLLISNETSDAPIGEVSLASGNFNLMALKVLDKCKREHNALISFAYDQSYIFNFHKKEGLSLLCMTDSSYSNLKAFNFLFEVRDKILHSYGSELQQAIAFSLKGHFTEEIKQLMISYNQKDKIAIVNENIQEVKNIMVQNLDHMLERGEKIELLVSKSVELEGEAQIFKKKAETVQKNAWGEYMKYSLIAGLLLVVTLAIAAVVACGGLNFYKCR